MEFIILIAIIAGVFFAWRKLVSEPKKDVELFEERRRTKAAEMILGAQKSWNETVNGAKSYPVGIVGESNYQGTIRHLRVGQLVKLLHEPSNPYDSRAIAVAASNGDTIGYIPRDFWLRDALLDEAKPCSARVLNLSKGPKATGVTIEVALAGEPIGERAFIRS